MVADDLQTTLFFIMCCLPGSFLLSLPAFYILRKRRKILYIDYGINLYPVVLFSLFFQHGNPHFSLTNLFVDPFLISLFSIVIIYLRLFLPKNWPTKIISISSIMLTLIATILIFYFIPPLPE